MIVCPLCQERFDERTTCHGCGLKGHCMLLRCPRCGYEFVEESKTVRLIRRFFKHETKEKKVLPDLATLDQVEVGGPYRILFIASDHYAEIQRLALLGIRPGVEARVHQRRPSFVVRVGETEIALDDAIAHEIYVKRSGDDVPEPATGFFT